MRSGQAWENLLIHAENVKALTRLRENRLVDGNVRLVYIDPPFSTRQVFRIGEHRTATVSGRAVDPVAYRDTLAGTDYLEFLRERLRLLHSLLAEDGSLYLHIDYKVGHYVKLLLDEIFGIRNFRSDITRIKCNPKNFARKGYGNIKDMILFYTKSSRFLWNEPREEMTEADLHRLFPRRDGGGRRYTTNPLHAPGETRGGPTGKRWKGMLPPPGRHWRVRPEELTRLERLGLIEWSSTGNPRKKIFADDTAGRGKRVQDVWEFKDPPYPAYPTQKNIGVIKRIISASSNPGDLVLDCFAGSGTTLVAAEELGRRWIGIDDSKRAIDVARERLRAGGASVRVTEYGKAVRRNS
jgi:adenine-specific DNA-methyltransferase